MTAVHPRVKAADKMSSEPCWIPFVLAWGDEGVGGRGVERLEAGRGGARTVGSKSQEVMLQA